MACEGTQLVLNKYLLNEDTTRGYVSSQASWPIGNPSVVTVARADPPLPVTSVTPGTAGQT